MQCFRELFKCGLLGCSDPTSSSLARIVIYFEIFQQIVTRVPTAALSYDNRHPIKLISGALPHWRYSSLACLTTRELAKADFLRRDAGPWHTAHMCQQATLALDRIAAVRPKHPIP